MMDAMGEPMFLVTWSTAPPFLVMRTDQTGRGAFDASHEMSMSYGARWVMSRVTRPSCPKEGGGPWSPYWMKS